MYQCQEYKPPLTTAARMKMGASSELAQWARVLSASPVTELEPQDPCGGRKQLPKIVF